MIREKTEYVKLLTDLELPLVRMALAKVSSRNSPNKWRRVPCEKWKGILKTDRPPESFHDCNVAVQTGNKLSDGRFLYILDIDLKKQDGRDTWKKICDTYGDPDFWAGPMSRTESGGLHLWFASEKQFNVQLSLFPGIDFLGLGALSFEPPSQFTEDSKPCQKYSWETPPSGCGSIPDLPTWILHELEIREIKHKVIREAKEKSDAMFSIGISDYALPFIEHCLSLYTPENGLVYNDWLRIGMSLHEGSGGNDAALAIFDAWGARVAAEKGGDYDEKKTRITWDSFGSRSVKVTYGTLVKILCNDKAVIDYIDESVKSCQNVFSSVTPNGGSEVTLTNSTEISERGQVVEHLNMDALLVAVKRSLNDPIIRTNQTNGSIEVTFHGEEMRRMDDAVSDRIILTCLDFGKKYKIKPLTRENFVEKAITLMADRNKYHPIRDYLDTCYKEYLSQDPVDNTIDLMKGKNYPTGRRYREKLFEGIALEPGEDEIWFRKAMDHWLRGAVCKAFHGYQNPMLVLQGEQGIGKSTLARALVKRIGTPYYYAGAIDPNDKDHKMKLAQLFLWEPDELGGTTFNADINKLKSLLTLTQVNERPPYGRYVVDMPVVCSFLGTVNNASFLKDETGSRRFLVAKFRPINPVHTINWLRGVEFDPNLLWGEVYAEVMYTGNTAPMLSGMDNAEAIERAEEVRVRSDLELVLEDIIEVQPMGVRVSDEWKLSRAEFRIALENNKVVIGRGVLAKSAEIMARMVGFRNPHDILTAINGIRYYRRCRVKSNIVKPPSMQNPPTAPKPIEEEFQ